MSPMERLIIFLGVQMCLWLCSVSLPLLSQGQRENLELKYFALFLSTENCVALTFQDFFLDRIQIEALLPVLIQIRALKILFFRLSVVFSCGHLYPPFLVSIENGLTGLVL